MSAFKPRLKVLYLGTLPPHQGGSAFSNAQILFGLAARGHRIQAIAPMAADVSNDYDAFADSHPEIDVTRFMMPHFETDPFNPASSDYRVRQTTQSLHLLGEMLTAEPRDVVFVGRESFIWGVPDLARQHRVPCVINLRGVINAIATGTYPHELGQALLAELRRTDCATVPARHMLEKLRSLGIAHGKLILNAVDATAFSCGAKAPGLMQKHGLSADETIVLHVSNLKSVKRVHDLIEFTHRALQENDRLVYVIVGDGPLRASLESACASQGLRDRV
ncbi:MAG: glycosyltransferase, partial [Proteobacteria bacterium]|nr:glycosyltransferase [Pseudomonadota bacterium]